MKPEIILGPPGTGKTTRLLKEVENTLAAGTPPNKIGFVAFTKKAANEAIERASTQFGLTGRQLPYFRTLHSLAFRTLGLSKDRMLNGKLIREFGHIMGLKISGKVHTDEGMGYGALDGDKALFISSLSRLRCVTLQEQWQENNEDMGFFEVDRVHRGLHKFKQARGIFDFTDLLEKFVEEGFVPELDLLVVDEAQDLSQLQWRMVHKLAKKATRVLIAGDDDQAIFQWAGADVPYFISLKGSVTVLSTSYRLPQEVFDKASSMINNINIRRHKEWCPRKDQGQVSYRQSPDDIDLSTGSWMVLARNAYLLTEVADKCRREGFLYEISGQRSVADRTLNAIKCWEALRAGKVVHAKDTHTVLGFLKRSNRNLPSDGEFSLKDLRENWGVKTDKIWHEAFEKMSLEERSYLVAALKRGEKPSRVPRINLTTIHGSKGGEADNVILYADIARRTHTDMQKILDNERRVFYVGMTRARENLHIILPQTDYFFPEI